MIESGAAISHGAVAASTAAVAMMEPVQKNMARYIPLILLALMAQTGDIYKVKSQLQSAATGGENYNLDNLTRSLDEIVQKIEEGTWGGEAADFFKKEYAKIREGIDKLKASSTEAGNLYGATAILFFAAILLGAAAPTVLWGLAAAQRIALTPPTKAAVGAAATAVLTQLKNTLTGVTKKKLMFVLVALSIMIPIHMLFQSLAKNFSDKQYEQAAKEFPKFVFNKDMGGFGEDQEAQAKEAMQNVPKPGLGSILGFG
ncbi:hypothetical protein [Nonomuraea sp. NPDC049400]|uniref:hypothetical protein n=1 Tax=Nonomuraea sp. NPDC049400 TaxID=3364352 RepID=UPI0037A80842